jgi:hypothetical protein
MRAVKVVQKVQNIWNRQRGNTWGRYWCVFKHYCKIRGFDGCVDGDLKHVGCYDVSAAKLSHMLERIISETSIDVV